ncbi:hypothetical protein Hanom_Chr09g00800681 [Helianthus anomalus]
MGNNNFNGYGSGKMGGSSNRPGSKYSISAGLHGPVRLSWSSTKLLIHFLEYLMCQLN